MNVCRGHLAFCLYLIMLKAEGQVTWSHTMKLPERFIENKSQFDGRNGVQQSPILYGVDWGATQIYFHSGGLTFRFDKTEKEDPYTERQRELAKAHEALKGNDFTRKEEEKHHTETVLVHLQWLGCNPDVSVNALDPAEDYFSYTVSSEKGATNINFIRGFSRLLYKNLYPGIDAEYTFHPQGGIKYKLILHPGADISRVRMQYSGGDVRIDEEGKVLIQTQAGVIVDHAPVSFYAKKPGRLIASRFFLAADNMIAFELDDYKVKKTVILDPWTVTPPMPASNKAYYVKTDANGNVYAYGGESPYRLVKYNAAGNLLWTYNSGWTAAGNWFGALAVDPAGNAYITSGSSAEIARINPAGTLVWQNASNGSLAEYWALSFNCDYTRLFVGGTRVTFPAGFGAAYEIDLNSGAVLTSRVVAYQTNDPVVPLPVFNEIRSMTASPNGNYYFLTLDTIGSLDASLNILYKTSSGYRLSYYLPYGQGGTGQGINGIAATPYFLYTTNGQVLHKRDINNGNILSTTFIPNGSVEVNSGVAVDSCGNVYVGAIGMVHKYDANLNLLLSVPVSGQVYDVAVSNNSEVVACGNGFVASLNMSSCKPQKAICEPPFALSMSHTNVSCKGQCDGTATVTPAGTPPYGYLWNNGQTGPMASNLCAGVYIVSVTDARGVLAIGSVIVEEPPALTVTLTSRNTTCGTTVLATPESGVAPFSYQWSNGATTAEITGLATGTYSLTITDANNCTANGSISVVQSPGFTVSTSVSGSACGSCDGTATAIPSLGTPPFGYQWSTGDTTPTASGLCPDIYFVTVTETGGGGNAVFWREDFTGGGAGWTLNLSGPGPNGNSPNRWVINNNRDNGCPICPASGSGGNYLHIACDSAAFFCTISGPSCTYSLGFPFLYDNSTDKFVSSSNISTVGKTNMVLRFWYISSGEPGRDYGLVRLSNDGGVTWTDLPTQYAGTDTCRQAVISIPPAYEGIPNFRIGFRWVNDNNSGGDDPPFMVDDIELVAPEPPCTAITSVIVNSANAPSVTIDTVIRPACKDSADGAVLISVTGGTPPYRYNWSTGDSTEDLTGITSGSYTVSVTDSANCRGISQFVVSEPTAISISATITAAGCTSGGAVDVTVSGGVPPYSYAWNNGASTEDLNSVQGGTYELTVTDANGCQRVASFTVVSPGIFVILNKTDNTCAGANDGAISTMVFGGSAPYQYAWSNGSTNASLDSIPAGTYSVTVTDFSGCSATALTTVEAPSALYFSASITKALCASGNDGGIKLNPFGGTPPYSALWSNGDTVLSIQDLFPGSYTVTVTDAQGCSRDTTIQLTSVSEFSVEIAATSASCAQAADGRLEVVLQNATTAPYTYLWSSGATSSSVSNLAPGIYAVTVTDTLRCMRTAQGTVDEEGLRTSVITTAASCQDIPDGRIEVTVLNGHPPYRYSWSNGASGPSQTNVLAGIYTLTVTDQYNCTTIIDSIEVPLDSTGTINCDSLIIYDVFSPNGDGVNDIWIINGLASYPENELQIYNRWGNVVYEARPYKNDWKGESKNGKPLPAATYYFILKLHDPAGRVLSGAITLIR
ncbi:MAG: hypothetical protein KatS3mg031_1620 [Chitinophagales bacterium]|nr:MAG: hypothetical protein KatS3mg031_1620 [Chitinophagales bacterium]